MHDSSDSASTEKAIVETLATAARAALILLMAAGLAHGAAELVAAL